MTTPKGSPSRLHHLLVQTEIPDSLPCLDEDDTRDAIDALRFIGLARQLDPNLRIQLVDTEGHAIKNGPRALNKALKRRQRGVTSGNGGRFC